MAKRKPITAKAQPKAKEEKKAANVFHSPKKKTAKKVRTVKIKKKSAVIFSAGKNWQNRAQQYSQHIQTQRDNLITSIETQIQALKKSIIKKRAKHKQKNSWQNRAVKFFAKKTAKFSAKTIKTKKLFFKKIQKLKSQTLRLIKKCFKPFRVAASAMKKFFIAEILGSFVYIFRKHLILTMICLLCSAGILIGSYEVYDIAFKDLPSVTELATRKQNLTTKILDRNGKLLYSIYKDENRTLVPLSGVPQNLVHATIAIEDRNFYSHRGISVRGIFRAFVSNAQTDRLQGGSTITQQLVKNTLLTPERTLKRKVREIVLAFIMEGTYSKDEILEMYFNEVGYGGSTYGVEEAAQRYFGKSVRELDLAECAFLAGLPAAPSAYSPFGATPEYAYTRQHEVLTRMVADQYITQVEADASKAEVLKFRADQYDIQAPHFVMYVKNLLEKQYGEDVVSQGGLEVRTTLDVDIQNTTQHIVTDEVNKLAPLNIHNGAAMMTNPKTGEILAMVGSKNYFDFANDGQVNVTTRPRQPGSSIKPLTYALALENGKTPSSTILDEPTVFSTPGSPPYAPKNYDGKFHGLVPLRTALASSFNIPAVKTLAEIGLNTMIDKGQQMGITTWDDRKRFGLSLTLGSGEVLMIDMTQLYGTFANYGETVNINPLLEVKNAKGEVLYHNTCALNHTGCPSTRTLDARVAYQITDILSDNNARTPAFGPRSVLYIPNQQVAVKTGTTNNLKDNWTIGYTEDRLVATWVGNNDGTPMSYVASGITGASPIWNKIIRTQLSDEHPHVFPTPDGLVKVLICVQTNTLPCQGCPTVSEELFTPGTEPTQACNPSLFAPKPSPTPTPVAVPTVPAVPVVPAAPASQFRLPLQQPRQSRDQILQGISTGR
jgi:1A family penicillin-binding protein